MPHRLKLRTIDHLKNLSPLGMGRTKPKHYREMLQVVLENRDNLSYAWKVLTEGVCDGCALGVAGLHDWTMKDRHLCLTRLRLLRLNTMPALDHERLSDVERFRGLNNKQLRDLGRLAYPMRRRRGEKGFTRITWDQALERIAEHIRGSDPKRLAFYLTSRGMTNESYYVAQKVVRFFGTNNIDNAARLCHAPSTAAMKRALGVAATTCSYKDWYGSDLIVFFGANPANDQPVTMKYLLAAKKLGTKVVLVNPYREPAMERYWIPSNPVSALFGTKIADHWFGVTKGGDIAFIYGVLKTMIEHGWHDEGFVENHTDGFDDLRAKTDALSWEQIETQSGMGRGAMEEFAELIRDATTAIFVWSMGITQHTHGTDGVQMILNLGLTKGFVGRDRCGLMPIRGHSGVQGGAEMGAYSTVFPGGKAINPENARELGRRYGFELPSVPGLITPEMIEAAARGDLDLLYCAGGNFLRTMPDPKSVADALARVPLRVHQDIILTDQLFLEPTCEDGEVILLPAKTRYEQEGGCTQTSTERRVMFSPEIPRQVGEAKAEWKIWLELAAKVDPKGAAKLGCENAQAIRNEIAEVVPVYDGIQNLKQKGDSFQYGGPHLCADWKFPTPTGKANFVAVELTRFDREPGLFEVTTRRGKQFNTLIHGEVDPINGAPRDAILINPEDAANLNVRSNDRIALVSELGRYEGRAFLAPLARGNLQVHWPEGNVLIPAKRGDQASGVPDYNARARIEIL